MVVEEGNKGVLLLVDTQNCLTQTIGCYFHALKFETIDMLQNFITKRGEIISKHTGIFAGSFHGLCFNRQIIGNDKPIGSKLCSLALL